MRKRLAMQTWLESYKECLQKKHCNRDGLSRFYDIIRSNVSQEAAIRSIHFLLDVSDKSVKAYQTYSLPPCF